MQLVVHLPGAHDDAADVRGFGSFAGAGVRVGLDGVVAHVAVADDGVEPVDKKPRQSSNRPYPVPSKVVYKD